jgi:hypothetical protein
MISERGTRLMPVFVMILLAAPLSCQEALVGTWVNRAYNWQPRGAKMIVKEGGRGAFYFNTFDPQSAQNVPFIWKVEKKGKDGQGNTYYNVIYTYGPDDFWKWMIRINPRGDYLEMVSAGRMANVFPSSINPDSQFYLFFYREM